jgi:hypothetical protein
MRPRASGRGTSRKIRPRLRRGSNKEQWRASQQESSKQGTPPSGAPTPRKGRLPPLHYSKNQCRSRGSTPYPRTPRTLQIRRLPACPFCPRRGLQIHRPSPRRPVAVSFTCGRKLRGLPVQQPCGVPVDRPRPISYRRIRAARTPRMLALPPLPAPLIIPKAKRTVPTPISAPRTRRRYPVVRPPSMLTPSTDRHASRLYQTLPFPATRPQSLNTR